ncbi:MAG: hypothetical protein C0424_10700 [Sphingobacteriaceae bacterium]|nr:hypothetical protein [Sphingobacteriaceae bacterium]
MMFRVFWVFALLFLGSVCLGRAFGGIQQGATSRCIQPERIVADQAPDFVTLVGLNLTQESDQQSAERAVCKSVAANERQLCWVAPFTGLPWAAWSGLHNPPPES